MPGQEYHIQQDKENTYKLRNLISSLPPYAKDFFHGIEPRTSSKTRIAYAYDLNIFFNYLHQNNSAFRKIPISNITLEHLEQLQPIDIEEYLVYLKAYDTNNQKEYYNGLLGLKRKLSTLKSFYRYFYKKEYIKYNPAALVEMPKVHEKNIVRLDIDEVAMLLDQVEQGDKLTARQQAFHNRTRVRDLAIMTLLLGTGVRVSECVGLNIDDVDFKNDGIKIHRKGGKEVVIYFGDEVESALLDYIEERKEIIPVTGHEEALFLSLQKKRINVRSVENLVKKYSRTVTTIKNITPHKLRSTYGTSLYRETGDIYLVADVLGHADVNTTKKHYAAIEDQHRRQARNAVKLREEE